MQLVLVLEKVLQVPELQEQLSELQLDLALPVLL
jgi:hypothetical protein